MSSLSKLDLRAVALLVGLSVVGGLAGWIYSSIADPVYQSSVLLMPEVDETANSGAGLNSGLSSIASLAGVSVGGEDRLRVEALATLRSRSFQMGFVRSENIAPHLFSDLWDSQARAWRNDEPSEDDIFKVFSEDVVKVREDSGDGLVTLSVLWHDSELAATWANGLADELNNVMRGRARELAKASIEYLERELNRTSNSAVQQAIGVLLEKQITNIMMANVRPQYAFRVIDPAVPSSIDNPAFPKPVLVTLAGFAFGLMLGAGLVAARMLSAQPRP
ncbi:MAG: hypothetical protein AAGL69_06705 [Pseudomonadota bacterium]